MLEKLEIGTTGISIYLNGISSPNHRMHRPKVCVIGCGIIGLSSAVCIQEAVPHSDVTIVAEDFPPNTVSNVAAGWWEPFCISHDQQTALDWGTDTYEYIKQLARSEIGSLVGAQLISGYQITDNVNPAWKDSVMGFRQMTDKELAMFPGTERGVFFTSTLLDPTPYMNWLMKRFQENGGHKIQTFVSSFSSVSDDYDILVNCTGLGANRLAGDTSVQPVKGQVIKVSAPWIKHFYVDDRPGNPPTYVLPSASVVTLGGTTDAGNWSEAEISTVKQDIWDRCLRLVPSLKHARVLFDKAGHRPYRPEVRLEAETLNLAGNSVKVIHNYGHGGAGITLHWGCAKDTAKLVMEYLATKSSTHSSKL